MLPNKIKISKEKNLIIEWENNTKISLSLEKLRKFCPCATCIAEREKQSINYIPILQENQIKVSKLEIVGSYAIKITWLDGHDTGIYEFPFLINLVND